MNSRITWWRRLGTRVSVLIALLSLGLGALALLVNHRQEEILIEEMLRGAVTLSHTIRSSIYHHMLQDQRLDAYQTMDSIGREPGIHSVRMLNQQGRITFSSQPKEVGSSPDRAVESCNACHEGTRPIGPCAAPSTHRFYNAGGHRVLGIVTPVNNEPACHTAACHAHPASQKVLGVIDLGLSLEAVDAKTARLSRQTLSWALLVILLLIGGAFFSAQWFVFRPVAALVSGMREVSEQRLGKRIPVRSSDELGFLAGQFNEMSDALENARAEYQDLLAQLEKLVEERTAALKQAQEQLVQSEKMSSLGKLSASIAHEINNPLMGILTVSKLLIRTFEGGAEADPARAGAVKQLKMVQRETERCSAIVRNLLDFARQRPLALKAIDPNAAIEEALSVAANQMAIQEIELSKDLQKVPQVHADLGQLRQAFLNVVLNACEAMPKRGKLGVSSRPGEGGGVLVEISDTGSGIAPEVLPKIFDPFFTTKEKGTGLGLSVVYGIVQRHGGKLEVKSELGKGTRILIEIPGAAPAEGRAA